MRTYRLDDSALDRSSIRLSAGTRSLATIATIARYLTAASAGPEPRLPSLPGSQLPRLP